MPQSIRTIIANVRCQVLKGAVNITETAIFAVESDVVVAADAVLNILGKVYFWLKLKKIKLIRW